MLRDAHYADAMIIMAGPGMMQSKAWPHNWGDGREAMVWREDCVASAVAVLGGPDSNSGAHEGQVYNITGPELHTCAELAALLSTVTGVAIAEVPLDDEQQYAMFDAMGIPRRPVDDNYVGGIPWNSDDMVTFGQAIRGGFLAICSNDVERLTGQPARSVRQMIEESVEMLRSAAG
jgi:NAD(P)H dehydrogenase (quinone)